ncbi:MAG: hypothetical protein GXY41_05200 [Phycisphaerae bacterium]|nr:hypothetical protein [Phycisphaerae bacterium]
MMFQDDKFKCRLFWGIVLLYVISATGFSMATIDPNEVVLGRLAKITAGNKNDASDYTQIEDACLALIQEFDSKAQIGRIYAELAKVYSGKGYSSRHDFRVAKTVEFSQKALQQPLDAVIRCEMYGKLTDALIAVCLESPPHQFAVLRREAAETCLQSLKIALDHNAPDVRPVLPALDTYMPDRQKVREAYNARSIRRKKWELESNFFYLKNGLTQMCVSLYSREPYNLDELRQLGQTILAGYPERIDELIDMIQDRISSKPKLNRN